MKYDVNPEKSLIEMDELKGWRVERWYELKVVVDEDGHTQTAGYFKDPEVAAAAGIGADAWGQDGKVLPVFVLTQNQKEGFILNPKEIYLEDEEAHKVSAREKALGKLKPAERKILGLE